jgi:hypothetical protein
MESVWPSGTRLPMSANPTSTVGMSAADEPLFHVVVNDFHRTFSIDASDSINGIRLHYEMLRFAREQNKNFREFDIRAASIEAAVAEVEKRFPEYSFLGTWADAQRK